MEPITENSFDTPLIDQSTVHELINHMINAIAMFVGCLLICHVPNFVYSILALH